MARVGWTVIVALMSGALVPPALAVPAPDEDAAALARQARRLEADGKLELAAALAREALALAPDAPDLHKLLGDLEYARESCAGALAAYDGWRRLLPAERRSNEEWEFVEGRSAHCRRLLRTALAVTVDVAAECRVDGQPPVALGAGERREFLVTPGEHQLRCAAPEALPVELGLPVPPGEILELGVALARPPPLFDAPPPPPPPDEAPPAPPVAARLRVQAARPGWSCRVDGGPWREVDAEGRLEFEPAPGPHALRCRHASAAPFERWLSVAAGEERSVELPAVAPAPAAPPPPTVVAPPAPAPRGAEWMLGGGFGPSYGDFGVAMGGRLGPVGLLVGSGLQPLALTATFAFSPGETGFFVSAGYRRIGQGLFVGGSPVASHGVFGAVGYDVRVVPHLGLRFSLGAATIPEGAGPGPLALELAAFYVP